MFGHSPFYNAIIRKHVVIFSTMFNDIIITRSDNNNIEQKRFRVPIEYGPHQKFLARLQADAELNRPEAIWLPRLSYEITNLQYDPTRRLGRLNECKVTNADGDIVTSRFGPIPYNIDFTLSILAKYSEDGFKIIEQILPFFTPEWTSTAELISGSGQIYDIPTILTSVSNEEVYEGTFEERQVYMWTLQFTMKGWFIGPTTTKKIIKFANVNMYSGITASTPNERIRVYPGLLANGSPANFLSEQVYNASATANVSGNSVNSIIIANNGLGYDSVTVTISDPDVGNNAATATATIENYRISAITITNPGSGYLTAPNVSISAPDNYSVSANQISRDDSWDYIVIIDEV